MPYKDDTEGRINAIRLKKLLTPSWLSGLISITAGLIVTAGFIFIFAFNNGTVRQQLISYQNTPSSQPALTLPGSAPPGNNNNSLQNTWPLIAFWGMIGFVAYFVVEFIVKIIRDAQEFTEELNYVHAKRNVILKTTAEYLLFRVAAAAIWLIFIDVFFKRIIPYSILAANASASDFVSVGGILDALLSFLMIAVSLHVNAIFLRLTLRKPRIFTSVDYLDI